jgi:hypothetical protein
MCYSLVRLAVRGSLVAVALLMGGCGGSSPTDPQDSARRLPLNLYMSGTASSLEADGTSVSCELSLHLQLNPGPRGLPSGIEYTGTQGGWMQRTVLDAAGDGISLWPDVYGDAIVRSIAPDRVEVRTPGNEAVESRFWREFAKLEGVFDSADTATGTWNCAPFDTGPETGGYEDTLYTAPGTWTLGPEP